MAGSLHGNNNLESDGPNGDVDFSQHQLFPQVLPKKKKKKSVRPRQIDLME